ncbi:hypothetical protein FQN54_006270 [Arachnomyces sp. PD_36]|nr:hypothetical protein FQN54_006270 [Arachnomyces sp. PD_36]
MSSGHSTPKPDSPDNRETTRREMIHRMDLSEMCESSIDPDLPEGPSTVQIGPWRSQGNPPRYIHPHEPHRFRIKDLPEQDRIRFHPEIWGDVAPITTFPISREHAIVPEWSKISSSMVEILEDSGLNWVSVECFMRKQVYQQDSEEHTCIMITIEDFETVRDTVKGLAAEMWFHSGETYFIEILQGRIRRGVDNLRSDEDGLRHDFPYNEQPPIAPYLYDENGPESPIRICHPSLADHNRTVQVERDRRRPYKKLVAKDRNFESYDSAIAQNQQLRRDIIASIRATVGGMHRADRKIGHVFATSGYGKEPDTNQQFDWGLVELKPGRVGSNTESLSRHLERDVSVVSDLPQKSNLENPEVLHVGSRSGVVEGTVNGAVSIVSFKDLDDHTIKSETMAVVSKSRETAFSIPGDSGALILTVVPDTNLTKYQVLGLLWGGSDKKVHFEGDQVSYFTPIEVVIRNIQKITGYTMRVAG